jgi:2,3-bisphosphoglycerate-independent phosphoglycerate mutase
MADFTAGHISSEEAARVIADLDKSLGNAAFQFHPGVSYRHLMVWRNGRGPLETTPPHDITGKATGSYLPRGAGEAEINDLMQRSRNVLKNHPVSQARLAVGKKQPTSIWLWGQGRAPRMVRLTDQYGFRGGVISAVDLLNGIGVYAGLQVIRVTGATGYTDTDYIGKAEAALAALREMDFVFVHVEAPDEMSHEGNLEGKIRAIEDFDDKVVGTVLQGIGTFADWRVMALSDHPTPLKIRTHAADPSAFAVLSSSVHENMKKGSSFHEKDARAGGILISPGHRLMELFIRNWKTFIAENRP